MAYAYQNTVMATFDNRRSADKAVADLKAAGFREAEIGLAGPHSPVYTQVDAAVDAPPTEEEQIEDLAAGAGAGAVTGAGAGALVGLGAMTFIPLILIPGIGPILAGGSLAVILASAAGGAAMGGVAGALIEAGASEVDAEHYERELKTGKTIVTVQAEGRADKVAEIFYKNGGHDRQNSWTAQHAKHRPEMETESVVVPLM